MRENSPSSTDASLGPVLLLRQLRLHAENIFNVK